MDIQNLVADAKQIATDEAPPGGNEYSTAVLKIFQENPGKKFSGKEIKQIFAKLGVELAHPSNMLYGLFKAGKLARPQTGWYTLA